MPGISINPFAARATTAGKRSCPCLNIFFSIFLHTFLFTWPGYKSRQVIPVLQPSQLPQQPMTCNQQDRMCLEVDCRCVRIFPLSDFAPENSKILFLDRMFPSAKRAKAVIWTWFSFPRWRNAGNVQNAMSTCDMGESDGPASTCFDCFAAGSIGHPELCRQHFCCWSLDLTYFTIREKFWTQWFANSTDFFSECLLPR